MDNEQQIINHAVYLLAGREHSCQELHRKLGARGASAEAIDSALAVLQTKNLQSDQRFAESFIRSRVTKKRGPIRIKMELRERGIDYATATAALGTTDADWFEMAKQSKIKRFGTTTAKDLKERAKHSRYLQAQGYNQEHIRYALDGHK